LLKDTPPADLLAAIRVIAAGDALLAPAVTGRLTAEFARRPEPGQQPAATLAGCPGGPISVPGAHAAAMRGVAGKPARQRNDLDHQRDTRACDGDSQQHPHRC